MIDRCRKGKISYRICSEENLRGTLDEIFSCPDDGIEVIVIDNASTDDTKEMLDSYKDTRLADKYNEINKEIT